MPTVKQLMSAFAMVLRGLSKIDLGLVLVFKIKSEQELGPASSYSKRGLVV